MSFTFSFGESSTARAFGDEHLREASEVNFLFISELIDRCNYEEVSVPIQGNCSNGMPTVLRKQIVPERLLPEILKTELSNDPSIGGPSYSQKRKHSAENDLPAAALEGWTTLARSDLVANVYEGTSSYGNVRTHDLLHLIGTSVQCGTLDLNGASVLEAGCGAGLPGILTMLLGASRLVLQALSPAISVR